MLNFSPLRERLSGMFDKKFQADKLQRVRLRQNPKEARQGLKPDRHEIGQAKSEALEN